MNKDEQSIHELVATWMAASKSGDLETVLGLMTDDVIFMVPNRAPFGKEAFAANSRAMSGVEIDGTSDIRELCILGDWAYLRNFIRVSIKPPDGKVIERSGFTLTILQKQQDGRWLLARDANLVA
ncbi:MAG TPA: SgcJ/EcaC family oxidoreductase [Lacipirellulaceae bacterium]|nr:SgcJ/EcaC family oxidoreductase [Lacipirellulaceae bacterium]